MNFGKYNLIDTKEKLKELDQFLMNPDGTPKFKLLAFDTETNGLHIHKSTMVGFSISTDSSSGFYIPILEWIKDPDSLKIKKIDKKPTRVFTEGKLRCVWTGEFFDEFVTPKEFNIWKRVPFIPAFMNRWLTKTNLVMQNGPFDVNIVWSNTGIELKDVLFSDVSLMAHILNENEPVGLKKLAELYKEELGINPFANAALEKKELDGSIIENGGKTGQVWRADLAPQSKYGCADTFLTMGIHNVVLEKFIAEFGDKGLQWYFRQEVMPVCREVVVDMKRNGVYIDVSYFEKLEEETVTKLNELEDKIIEILKDKRLLVGFNVGKSVEEAVSKQALIKEIAKLENLSIPMKKNKDGVMKESLAKGEVKKAFNENPHWLWGYLLGEDELRYSDKKLEEIRNRLYQEREGRRHHFNIRSDRHLRWLFCDKLGMSKTALPQTDTATKKNPIPSMKAEVLKQFMLPKYDWVKILMTYKKLYKLESTYIRPAITLNQDGWLYMDMKQNGTISGRFSCSGGYNLQTLPRVDDEMEVLGECGECHSKNVEIIQEIGIIADRKCLDCEDYVADVPRPSAIKQGFIAPPGTKIVNADYSSLEPRCFAYVSGEDKIKEVYWKDLDLYSKVYCDIFDKENQFSPDPKADNFLKKVAPAKRKWVKPIVLGIPYGSEEEQVANLMNEKIPKMKNGEEVIDEMGNPVMIPNTKEGRRVIDEYLGGYQNLAAYMERQEEMAVTLGYVTTLIGRKRHLPFAKKINDVLEKNNIHYKDLVKVKPWKLKEPNVSYVSKLGTQVTLTEDMLEEIRDSLGVKKETLIEGGYWAKIRGMLKSDLNNAKNFPIQGLAGHMTNRGMLEANRLARARGLKAHVCLQVHDEIGMYSEESQAQETAECLREGMENNEFTKLIDIDMIAEPCICDNLKESK